VDSENGGTQTGNLIERGPEKKGGGKSLIKGGGF